MKAIRLHLRDHMEPQALLLTRKWHLVTCCAEYAQGAPNLHLPVRGMGDILSVRAWVNVADRT